MEYHLNTPIFVDGTWKILVNHIMIKKVDNLFAGLEAFPVEEWSDIKQAIMEKIAKTPKLQKRGYIRREKKL
jgi:hypothetical protein